MAEAGDMLQENLIAAFGVTTQLRQAAGWLNNLVLSA